MNLRVDPGFKKQLVPLSDASFGALEAECLAEGIRDALVVWEETGILLDGHNRYRIAQKYGLPFQERLVPLASREEAEDWIDRHQLARRNLMPKQIRLLIGRRYNRAKKPVGSTGGDHRSERANRRNQNGNVDRADGRTCVALAKEHGVGMTTVLRAGKFAAAVDKVKAVDVSIEEKVLSGEGPTEQDILTAAAAIDAGDARSAAEILVVKPKVVGKKKYTPETVAPNGSPSDGTRIAKSAAGKLNEIHRDDIQREKAFAYMRRWLDAHES